MKISEAGIKHIRAIKPLTHTERDAIAEALRAFIFVNGEKRAWAQKVILEEMLHELMWAQLEEQP